jgi:homogentisate 1,2-dioxygenase
MKGALPVGRNSPQRAPKGTVCGSAVGHRVHRAARREPLELALQAAAVGDARPLPAHEGRAAALGPFTEVETSPNRLRWDPLPLPSQPSDFIDGLATIAGSGDPAMQSGVAAHIYRANRSMKNRVFWNADGELMFVPNKEPSSLSPSSVISR